MKNLFFLFKTTAMGGLVFLVPLVLATAILGKGLVLMRLAVSPLREWLGLQLGVGSGILLFDILILLMLLVACLVAGLAARSSPGRRLWGAMDSKMSALVPGYLFVKGITDSFANIDAASSTLKPVVARFDDTAQLAFEIERAADGEVVVYLPGAPNPWAGTVVFMSPDRVRPLKLTAREAVRSIQRLGMGTACHGAVPGPS